MQQLLKAAVRPARARVVAAELFEQILPAVDDADAALHVRLGRETAPALTRALESRARRGMRYLDRRCAWRTSWRE
jgi:hypothetical protein